MSIFYLALIQCIFCNYFSFIVIQIDLPNSMKQDEHSAAGDIISNMEKTRNAIIVVGKMGHGKSSFINTLILPHGHTHQQLSPKFKQDLLPFGSELESVTKQCYIRQVHASHKIASIDEQLILVDTPGLDSEQDICLVCEQIDYVITNQKCNIIGVAFVVNLKEGRLINGKGKNILKQFLTLLKINKFIKNKLLYFVLTKWDHIADELQVEEQQKLVTQFQKIIADLDIQSDKNDLLKWVSPYSVKPKQFKRYLNENEGEKKIKFQFQKMRQIVSQRRKYMIDYKTHSHNILNFWKKTVQKVLKQANQSNLKYKIETNNINYNIKLKLKENSFLDELSKSSYFKVIDQIGKKIDKIQNEKVQKICLGLLLPFVIPTLPVGFGVSGLNYLFHSQNMIEQIFKRKSNKGKKARKQDQFLIKYIQNKLQNYVLKSTLKNIHLIDEKITFDKNQSMLKVNKLFISYLNRKNNKKIPFAKLNKQDLKNYHQIKIVFKKREQLSEKLEEKVIEHFKDQNLPKQIRIPKQNFIYVNGGEDQLDLYIQLSCCLPQHHNYYQIIVKACEQNYGKYK